MLNKDRLRTDSPATISKRKIIKIKRMLPLTGQINEEVFSDPKSEVFLTNTTGSVIS